MSSAPPFPELSEYMGGLIMERTQPSNFILTRCRHLVANNTTGNMVSRMISRENTLLEKSQKEPRNTNNLSNDTFASSSYMCWPESPRIFVVKTRGIAAAIASA